MKKIIWLLMLLMGLGMLTKILIEPAGFNITIKNETGMEISGLYLTYNEIRKDIEIPAILPGKKNKIEVRPQEEFGENSMTMYYFDADGVRQEETVIGYFEKGYYGEVMITLKSVNQQGVIEMEMKEDIL